MQKQAEILSITEQTTISEALLRLIASWSGLPKGIKPQWQRIDGAESLGIYTLQGAVYLRRDILGGFTAQFPFKVLYATTAADNKSRLTKQKVLDDLGEWLEAASYPDLTDKRTITGIERTTTSFKAGENANGTELYQCNLMLRYRKEGGLEWLS